jgi:energy-coupling factor transporter ATP-binding protein EcfA2
MTQDLIVQTPARFGTASGAVDAVTLDGVSRSFGAVRAVDGVTVGVRRGETVALLGPNGAGKTTTITMLLGLMRPDEGAISVLGMSPDAAIARGLVGAMLQDGGMMPGVQVGELLAMVRTLFSAPLTLAEAIRIAQLRDSRSGVWTACREAGPSVSVSRLRSSVTRSCSSSMSRQRRWTSRRDAISWNEMRGFTDRGRTLLFSTHYLEEADLSGPRLALDRQVGWLRQLRLTPLSPSRVLAVRLITAMILGLPAICLTFITAAIVKDVGLPLWEWPVLVLLIAAGCLPFAAMGIVVGSSAARRRRVAPSHAAPSVIGH